MKGCDIVTFIENSEKDKDSKTPEMETDVYPLTHVAFSNERITSDIRAASECEEPMACVYARPPIPRKDETSDIRAASEREVPMACVYAGPPIPRIEEKTESFFTKLLRKIKFGKR